MTVVDALRNVRRIVTWKRVRSPNLSLPRGGAAVADHVGALTRKEERRIEKCGEGLPS